MSTSHQVVTQPCFPANCTVGQGLCTARRVPPPVTGTCHVHLPVRWARSSRCAPHPGPLPQGGEGDSGRGFGALEQGPQLLPRGRRCR